MVTTVHKGTLESTGPFETWVFTDRDGSVVDEDADPYSTSAEGNGSADSGLECAEDELQRRASGSGESHRPANVSLRRHLAHGPVYYWSCRCGLLGNHCDMHPEADQAGGTCVEERADARCPATAVCDNNCSRGACRGRLTGATSALSRRTPSGRIAQVLHGAEIDPPDAGTRHGQG